MAALDWGVGSGRVGGARPVRGEHREFADIKDVSVQRLAYWRKRLRAAAPARFVHVDVSTATRYAEPRVEIVVDCVVVRVREELDADKLVRRRRPRPATASMLTLPPGVRVFVVAERRGPQKLEQPDGNVAAYHVVT